MNDEQSERLVAAFERLADELHGIRKHLESVDLWDLSRVAQLVLENIAKTGRP